MDYRYNRIKLSELVDPKHQDILAVTGLTADDIYTLLETQKPEIGVILSNLPNVPIIGCIIYQDTLLTHQNEEYVRYNIEIPEKLFEYLRNIRDVNVIQEVCRSIDHIRKVVSDDERSQDLPVKDNTFILHFLTKLEKSGGVDLIFAPLKEALKLRDIGTSQQYIQSLHEYGTVMMVISQIFHDLVHLLHLDSVKSDPVYTTSHEHLEILNGMDWTYQQHFLFKEHFIEEFGTLHLEYRHHSREFFFDVFQKIRDALDQGESNVLLSANELSEKVYAYKNRDEYTHAMNALSLLSTGFVEKTTELVVVLQVREVNDIESCLEILLNEFPMSELHADSLVKLIKHRGEKVTREMFVQIITYLIQESVMNDQKYTEAYRETSLDNMPLPGLVFENTDVGKKSMAEIHALIQSLSFPSYTKHSPSLEQRVVDLLQNKKQR